MTNYSLTPAFRKRTNYSSWWLSSIPLAVSAGFWGSYDSKEVKLEDIVEKKNKIEDSINKMPAQDVMALIDETMELIMQLSAKELARDFISISKLVATLAEYVGSHYGNKEKGLAIVDVIYRLGEKVADSSKKIDSVRIAHQALFPIYMAAEEWSEGIKIIQQELEIVRQMEQTPTSLEQSGLLFTLATLSGIQNDVVKTEQYLRDSVKLFAGISSQNITPQIEDFWRGTIVSALTYSFTLTHANLPITANIFKDISQALYEQFKAVVNRDIPPFKDVERYAKEIAKQQQSQHIP